MAKKEILCAFGVDVDAVAGWLGSYGGEDSPDDISRGLFAGEVGAPRLLKLFERYNLKTTWFIPGHSIETFPEQMKAVVDAGHEVGVHGYSHENPIAMTREQERDVLDYNIELVTQLSGKRPTGYVAPWWFPWSMWCCCARPSRMPEPPPDHTMVVYGHQSRGPLLRDSLLKLIPALARGSTCKELGS